LGVVYVACIKQEKKINVYSLHGQRHLAGPNAFQPGQKTPEAPEKMHARVHVTGKSYYNNYLHSQFFFIPFVRNMTVALSAHSDIFTA